MVKHVGNYIDEKYRRKVFAFLSLLSVQVYIAGVISVAVWISVAKYYSTACNEVSMCQYLSRVLPHKFSPSET